jgi:hypothetical protein
MIVPISIGQNNGIKIDITPNGVPIKAVTTVINIRTALVTR